MATSKEDAVIRSHRLVAHFLALQGYRSTLEALRKDVASSSLLSEREAARLGDEENDGDPDLRDVIESYLSEKAAARLKALRLDEVDEAREPLETRLEGPRELQYRVAQSWDTVHSNNIITCDIHHLPRRSFDSGSLSFVVSRRQCVVTSGADKRVAFTDLASGEVLEYFEPTTAATLSIAFWPMAGGRVMATGSMDGKVVLTDIANRATLHTLNAHRKFVVRVAFSPCGRWLASASYDRTITIFELEAEDSNIAGGSNVTTEDEKGKGGAEDADEELARKLHLRVTERHRHECSTNPEAILFTPNGQLAYTLRSDCFIHYLSLPNSAPTSGSTTFPVGPGAATIASEQITQSSKPTQTDPFTHVQFNTNVNDLDLHVSYSLLSIGLHPSGRYISLQTGDHATSSALTNNVTSSGALSRILLLPLLSGERVRTLWTGTEAGAYASPRHMWLKDGSGVVISGEDGCVRVIDVSGKVRACIRAHGEAAVAHGTTGTGPVTVGWGGNNVVRDVAVVPGSRTVVSVGYDRTIKVLEEVIGS